MNCQGVGCLDQSKAVFSKYRFLYSNGVQERYFLKSRLKLAKLLNPDLAEI